MMPKSKPPEHSPMRTATPTKGFSIVELLVVMAVGAILIGLVVFALGANKAAALRQGGLLAGTVVEQARELAMGSRRPTALAIVKSGPDAYRKMLVLQKNDSGEWVTAGRSTVLPNNVIVDYGSTGGNFLSAATNSITNAVVVAGASLTPGSGFVAQEFSWDGSLFGQLMPLILRLREGYVVPGQSSPMFTAGTTNRYFDVVTIPAGGRVKYVQP